MTREAETALTIEVTWRDLRAGHDGDVLSNRKRFDPTQLPLPGEAPETARTNPNPAIKLNQLPSSETVWPYNNHRKYLFCFSSAEYVSELITFT